MAQHFLLSAAARSLSPAKVMRMSDRGGENVFLRLRWPETDGKPVCPTCGCLVCYDCRRPAGQARKAALIVRMNWNSSGGGRFLAWRHHDLPGKACIAATCSHHPEPDNHGRRRAQPGIGMIVSIFPASRATGAQTVIDPVDAASRRN
jgi:hypothetical protein